MHGLLEAGMRNCGKHFPGHGFVKADSHHEVPVDKRSLAAILADDARPYEWLSTSLAAVMPAHIVYSKVDAYPAGFSARWLKDILRLQLAFNGAIFSDDLSMRGARRLAFLRPQRSRRQDRSSCDTRRRFEEAPPRCSARSSI
jgi:beta-N-acetylhexosaminidase